LDFTINDGDFITIIGSNGAGKSTLLNVLNGQIIPDGGNVVLNGNDITNVEQHKRAKWISQVYQNPTMGTAPSMTVLENLSMAKNKGKRFNFTFGLDVKNIEFYTTEIQHFVKLSVGFFVFCRVFCQLYSCAQGNHQSKFYI